MTNKNYLLWQTNLCQKANLINPKEATYLNGLKPTKTFNRTTFFWNHQPINQRLSSWFQAPKPKTISQLGSCPSQKGLKVLKSRYLGFAATRSRRKTIFPHIPQPGGPFERQKKHSPNSNKKPMKSRGEKPGKPGKPLLKTHPNQTKTKTETPFGYHVPGIGKGAWSVWKWKGSAPQRREQNGK